MAPPVRSHSAMSELPDTVLVRELGARGRGLVAARDVKTGDLLLQEYPLLVIDGEDNEVGVPTEFRLNSNVYRSQVMHLNLSLKQLTRLPEAKCWSSLIQ